MFVCTVIIRVPDPVRVMSVGAAPRREQGAAQFADPAVSRAPKSARRPCRLKCRRTVKPQSRHMPPPSHPARPVPDLVQDVDGVTALMYAAIKGCKACVAALLRAHANTELLNKGGMHEAALAAYVGCEPAPAAAAARARYSSQHYVFSSSSACTVYAHTDA